MNFELSKASATANGFDTDCVPNTTSESIPPNPDHLTINEALVEFEDKKMLRASKFCGKSLEKAEVKGDLSKMR